ncbi:uncharacterized protein LOC106461647 isoform X2 [Limulus polyphemus]|uniref:Uncharacterized protein LOC106461647 isoform X2 n=1 Tax=Limulus polyphemus TaxID=6850 RepID=A0ABM1B8H2_LIMPO|nr:uncharacterized protein LOC106461647 isoform X2 [Limulus polyphemus]
MRTWIILACSIATVTTLPRYKRRPYELSDGAEDLVGDFQTTFSCPGNGYFADVDNNCQTYHLCQRVTYVNGQSKVLQWRFLCGNITVFNQLTLTRSFPDEVVQCAKAKYFFYLNDNIGLEDALFQSEPDVEKAGPLLVEILYLVNRKPETEVPVAADLPPDIRILADFPVGQVMEKVPEDVETPSDVMQGKNSVT